MCIIIIIIFKRYNNNTNYNWASKLVVQEFKIIVNILKKKGNSSSGDIFFCSFPQGKLFSLF